MDKRYPPVIEMSNTLPPIQVNLSKILALRPGYRFSKYIYLSPLEEWFELIGIKDTVYINAYSLVNETQKVKFLKKQNILMKYEEDLRWRRIDQASFVTVEEGYVKDVPYAFWSYGCSPTASTMIMAYWDERGYGRLVDYYFDRWDNVEKGNDLNLHNIHRELAIGMHTDSMYSGGTGLDNITPGHIYAANTVNKYSFECYSSSQGNASNSWNFSMIKDEIDEKRPVHWAVLNYDYYGYKINHSVCAVGYKIDDAGDTLIRVHNTWTTGEPLWALHTPGSYSYVYPVHPKGEIEEDIRLEFPRNGEKLVRGISYPLIWSYKGNNFSEVKVWKISFREGNKQWFAEWELLGTVEEGNVFRWIPEKSEEVRFQVELYYGFTLLASDGSVIKSEIIDPPDENIVFHYPIDANAYTISFYGNEMAVAKGAGGIEVFTISQDGIFPDTSLDDFISYNVVTYGKYIFADNGKKLLKISWDSMGVEKEHSVSYLARRIVVSPQYVIFLTRNYYLYVFDHNLILVDSLYINKAYSVCIDANNLLVGTLKDTVFIFSINHKLTPSDTLVVSASVIDMEINGNRLYVAHGIAGVGVYDLDAKAKIDSLQWENDRITKLKICGEYLYCLGANSIYVYLLNLNKLEYVKSFGCIEKPYAVVKRGNYIYVADGKNITVCYSSYPGVEENNEITMKIPNVFFSIEHLKKYLTSFKGRIKIYTSDGRFITDLKGLKENKIFPSGVYFGVIENKRQRKNFKLVLLK